MRRVAEQPLLLELPFEMESHWIIWGNWPDYQAFFNPGARDQDLRDQAEVFRENDGDKKRFMDAAFTGGIFFTGSPGGCVTKE